MYCMYNDMDSKCRSLVRHRRQKAQKQSKTLKSRHTNYTEVLYRKLRQTKRNKRYDGITTTVQIPVEKKSWDIQSLLGMNQKAQIKIHRSLANFDDNEGDALWCWFSSLRAHTSHWSVLHPLLEKFLPTLKRKLWAVWHRMRSRLPLNSGKCSLSFLPSGMNHSHTHTHILVRVICSAEDKPVWLGS